MDITVYARDGGSFLATTVGMGWVSNRANNNTREGRNVRKCPSVCRERAHRWGNVGGDVVMNME